MEQVPDPEVPERPRPPGATRRPTSCGSWRSTSSWKGRQGCVAAPRGAVHLADQRVAQAARQGRAGRRCSSAAAGRRSTRWRARTPGWSGRTPGCASSWSGPGQGDRGAGGTLRAAWTGSRTGSDDRRDRQQRAEQLTEPGSGGGDTWRRSVGTVRRLPGGRPAPLELVSPPAPVATTAAPAPAGAAHPAARADGRRASQQVLEVLHAERFVGSAHRPACTPRCWTRASTCARSRRCTGCCASAGRPAIDAGTPPTRPG